MLEYIQEICNDYHTIGGDGYGVALNIKDKITSLLTESTQGDGEHKKYEDTEADGIVFCGKCGKQK